jgi:uncharacterized membrane protein YedE/YeeE
MGIGFGVLLKKSGVANLKTVRKQMSLESMTIVKTAVTSLSTACLVGAIGHGMGWIRPLHYPMLTVKPVDVIGGGLLGVGLYLAGGTPETLLVQLGSGKQSVLWAILGEYAGTLVYGLIQPMISGKTVEIEVMGTKTDISLAKDLSSGTLDFEILKVAIPLTAFLIGGLWVLEELFPEESHKKTVAQEEAGPENLVLRKRWSPYICGTLMGLFQVGTLALTGIGLSSSSSYVAILGHFLNLFKRPNNYFLSAMLSVESYLEIVFHASLFLGGFFASRFLVAEKTKKTPKTLSTKQKILSFLGGVAVIVGTRMTDRCTSSTTKIICSSFPSLALALGSGIIVSRLVPRFLLKE